jgi:hypothetical protein
MTVQQNLFPSLICRALHGREHGRSAAPFEIKSFSRRIAAPLNISNHQYPRAEMQRLEAERKEKVSDGRVAAKERWVN